MYVVVKGFKGHDSQWDIIKGVFSTMALAKEYAERHMNSWWEHVDARGDYYHYWKHSHEYWAIEGWEVDDESGEVDAE